MTAGLTARRVGVRAGGARLLDGVSLDVPAGGWLAVVGPNGAGKSTLIRALAGLVRHAGTVTLDLPGGPVELSRLAPRQRARAVGYAPQVPVLPAALAVREYVLLGRTAHRPALAAPGRADHQAVRDALGRLDLAGHADRALSTLSGGERQRAVLARALAQQPSLLLLDEPTAALDLGHAQRILDLLDDLRRTQGLTVVCSLHDLTLAGQYPDQVALLAGGRLQAHGPPAQVLTPDALAVHYQARVEVRAGPHGLQVIPVRAGPAAAAYRSLPA